MVQINIAEEFTRLPGPRFREEGENSGEEFRERFLRPRFDEAVAKGEPLVVMLDGSTFGYPTSFLEEAFGGLAREVGIDQVLSVVQYVSKNEPLLPREVESYILQANKTSRERARAAS